MTTPTVHTADRIVKPLRIGPRDEGLELTYEQFLQADYERGFKYEIINGRIDVSPLPGIPHDDLELWLFNLLNAYSAAHSDVANYVTPNARLFVPRVRKTTCPEPDIAVFKNYPRHLPRILREWRMLTPILAVEVVSASKPEKDLDRNVRLYRRIPSIAEYWILEPRPDPDKPTLIVYRRRGQRWQKPIVVPYGETYETKLLPGFKLLVDPDAGVASFQRPKAN